jgi:flagella synthesis protein FlgN
MQASAFADTLNEELAAALGLLELLRKEQQYLVGAEIGALEGITSEKAAAVARMTELAQRRHRALKAAGHAGDESGMQAWIAAGKATPQAREAWEQLIGTTRSAKEFNRLNGMLINQHLARNQNALRALQGAPQTGNLYGPNGQTSLAKGRRNLVIG